MVPIRQDIPPSVISSQSRHSTRTDGWVWVFACVDHDTAEAWAHVAKVGDRFAALQPVCDAVIDRWGRLDADVARGLALRHD